MRDERRPQLWIPLSAAILTGAGGFALMTVRAPVAAVALLLVGGSILAFVVPRSAWLLGLVLWGLTSAGAAVGARGARWALFAGWCPPTTGNPISPSAAIGALLGVTAFATIAGFAAHWFIARLASLGESHRVRGSRLLLPGARVLAVAAGMLIVLYAAASAVSPLQPYGLNDRYCWDEFCFKVLSVERVKALGAGHHRLVARGEFYIVSADMESPWWGRFEWSDGAVIVTDYAGRTYEHSGSATRALGGIAQARAGCHQILGASERETVVFDLPADVVQPRLLLRDTLGIDGFIGGLRGPRLFVRPAFNLRYD